MVEQISVSAQAAVESLISSLHDWLIQLVWYSGCQVTSVADADSGWVVARIQDGTNQRCKWQKLFSIAVGDYVDVLYDPRTMQFEIFKPGGATIWSDTTFNADQDSIRFEYTNSSTGTLNFGEVVVFDSGADLAVDTTTTLGDITVAGVVVVGAAVGSLVQVAQLGIAHVIVDGNVTRGQYLKTSTTRGYATPTTGLERGTFAISLTGNTAGSGATVEAFVAGHSWFTQSSQTVTAGPYGCDFTLPSAAIAYINGLAAGPASGTEFTVEMQAGTFTDSAANVTIPQYVHVRGQGEATIWDMGDFRLIMSDDTSLESIIVTSTGDDSQIVLDIIGDNAVVREVRVIATGTGNPDCVDVHTATGVELHHVIAEATGVNSFGFYIYGTSTVLMWDCEADDTTNFLDALLIGDSTTVSTCTTKFCTFRGWATGDDVDVRANSVWEHFCCNTLNNIRINAAATETPLPHCKTNFDNEVTLEDGITMDGASGANVITVPDNVVQAVHIVDAGDANDYVTIVSTDGSREVVINEDGDANIDHRVEATGDTHAQFTRGSDGRTGFGVSDPDTRVDVNGAITVRELSADPANPDEGSAVIWMSDGVGTGDDGDILVKITAGGATKTVTLVDFSVL